MTAKKPKSNLSPVDDLVDAPEPLEVEGDLNPAEDAPNVAPEPQNGPKDARVTFRGVVTSPLVRRGSTVDLDPKDAVVAKYVVRGWIVEV